jgi:hypothetical protein
MHLSRLISARQIRYKRPHRRNTASTATDRLLAKHHREIQVIHERLEGQEQEIERLKQVAVAQHKVIMRLKDAIKQTFE